MSAGPPTCAESGGGHPSHKAGSFSMAGFFE